MKNYMSLLLVLCVLLGSRPAKPMLAAAAAAAVYALDSKYDLTGKLKDSGRRAIGFLSGRAPVTNVSADDLAPAETIDGQARVDGGAVGDGEDGSEYGVDETRVGGRRTPPAVAPVTDLAATIDGGAVGDGEARVDEELEIDLGNGRTVPAYADESGKIVPALSNLDIITLCRNRGDSNRITQMIQRFRSLHQTVSAEDHYETFFNALSHSPEEKEKLLNMLATVAWWEREASRL